VSDSLFASLWNLLFPRRCAGCGRWGFWLCPACVAEIGESWSRAGGSQRGNGRSEVWRTGAVRGTSLSGLLAMAPYVPPLKPAIHQFKYRFVADVGLTLGDLLADFAKDRLPAGDLLIVPVPLHHTRLRWRGFNQSGVLAKRMASRLALPYDEAALRRVRATDPQVNLDAASRRGNVRGAFNCIDPNAVRGKMVIVVDDVATTLATLDECARVLRAAGARDVWGLVLAQG